MIAQDWRFSNNTLEIRRQQMSLFSDSAFLSSSFFLKKNKGDRERERERRENSALLLALFTCGQALLMF